MGINAILNQKFTCELMNQVCLYDWEFNMGRDYSCYLHKTINGKKTYIIYDPYTDKFKHSIIINDKEYPYPKTIGEFVKNCDEQGIEIEVKPLELKNGLWNSLGS